MGRMSHREYRLWLVRQQGDLDRPSLTDHYIMKLMSIVASFSGQAVDPESMKIEWVRVEKEDIDESEMDIEDLSNAARQSSEAARAVVIVRASNDPRRRRQ